MKGEVTIEQLAKFLREGDIHYNTGYAADCDCHSYHDHKPECILIIESLEDSEKIFKFMQGKEE